MPKTPARTPRIPKAAPVEWHGAASDRPRAGTAAPIEPKSQWKRNSDGAVFEVSRIVERYARLVSPFPHQKHEYVDVPLSRLGYPGREGYTKHNPAKGTP